MENSLLWIQLVFNIVIFDIILLYAKVESLKFDNSSIYLVIINVSIAYKIQETLNHSLRNWYIVELMRIITLQHGYFESPSARIFNHLKGFNSKLLKAK